MITLVRTAAFSGQMQIQIEKDFSRELRAALRKLGEGNAVTKFLNSYGSLRTKKAYCVHLTVYFRWLREEKGVFS